MVMHSQLGINESSLMLYRTGQQGALKGIKTILTKKKEKQQHCRTKCRCKGSCNVIKTKTNCILYIYNTTIHCTSYLLH